MSNRNRKAKGTTMVDKKLAKAKERIQKLEQQVASSQMQVLNLRQMYEAAIQEKQGLQAQIQRTTTLLLGAVLQTRGKTLTLKEKTFEKLEGFIGFDTKLVDGDLEIRPVTEEEIRARQDIDFEDDEDEQE